MLLPRTTGETVASDLDWFFRRDGSMFPVSYVSVPLEMRDGRGAVVAFTDIEDRLRSKQALREHDATLAAQQASLQRVATLVAGGAASADVFATVAEEVGHVIGLPLVAVALRVRRDGDRARRLERSTAPVPGRHPLAARRADGHRAGPEHRPPGEDRRLRRPPRHDRPGRPRNRIRACAAAPIIVDGEIWGAMSTDSTDAAPLPDDLEDRLVEFTELLAATFSTTAKWTSSPSVRTSRPRCGASRRSSLAASPRPSSSQRSSARSPSTWT